MLNKANIHLIQMNPLNHYQREVIMPNTYPPRCKFFILNLLAWNLLRMTTLMMMTKVIKMPYLEGYTSSSPMNQAISGH